MSRNNFMKISLYTTTIGFSPSSLISQSISLNGVHFVFENILKNISHQLLTNYLSREGFKNFRKNFHVMTIKFIHILPDSQILTNNQ